MAFWHHVYIGAIGGAISGVILVAIGAIGAISRAILGAIGAI